MEYKKIDELSIGECCAELNIESHQLPRILENISGPQEIVDRLKSLVDADMSAFKSCSTIEQFEKYLELWIDGLHRSEAAQRVAQLKAQAEELAFYKTNQNSISGLESYIKKYPNGRFIQEAKGSLANKKKARKIRNIILLIIAIVIALVVCLINYFPVSYLDVSGDASLGKRGGNKTITISTDANDINIDVLESSNWIDVNRVGGTLSINVVPNTDDERSVYITVNTYSSFFGKKFNCISKKIKVSQSSGLPTYLKTNTSKISFDKYGNCSSNQITASTDGCDLQVSTSASWFSVSKNITEDGDNMVASIVLTTGTNNEGSKTGEVVIRCNDYVEKVKVSQASGLATYFRVEKTSLTMAEEGTAEDRCYPIDVYTDGTSWSVYSAPSWLTAYADLEDKRLEIKVPANTGKIKSGTITIKSNNGDLRDISVSQDGDPTNFGAAKSSIKFGTSSDYEYVTIYNDSRKQPSISEYESWISTSVINKNRIKISCNRNYDDPPRSGTVYVSCGDEQVSIIVKQDGWSKCRRCGGDGELDCPNNGRGNFPQWEFQYKNGIHYYVEWPMAMGIAAHMKRYERCKACGGSGHIECPDCDGEGKSYKSY